MTKTASDLKAQLLLAALACSEGTTDVEFTAEALLVIAWERNKAAWGLRGLEKDPPDSHRIHRELDSRGKTAKGLVALGLLERVRPRVYRLTPKGLVAAGKLHPSESATREKVDRQMEDQVRRMLEHPTFKKWLADPETPRRFREAGSFWRVAAGTPPKVIASRIERTEATLAAALSLLNERKVDEMASGRGQLLFERSDIERCIELNSALKRRFADDLAVLGVKLVAAE